MVIVLFLILVLFLLIFKLGSAALQVREQKGWKILRILFTFEGEKKERDKYIDAGRSPTLFKWRCGFWFGGSGDREAPSIEEGGVVCNMAWHSPTMLPGPCSLFFQTCRAISQGCAPVLLSQTATTRPTKRDTVRTNVLFLSSHPSEVVLLCFFWYQPATVCVLVLSRTKTIRICAGGGRLLLQKTSKTSV